MPKFPHLRAALKNYDVLAPLFTAEMYCQCETNNMFEALQAAERAALEQLAQALYEDTKDRNKLENCRLVPLSKLREWAVL